MAIGIGGAGSKLALQLDPQATVVNVSETELAKLEADHPVLAVVHAAQGQLRGSRKSPEIGRDAFLSVKRELLHLLPGNIVFSSTGGGTGNGITASILEWLTGTETVEPAAKTQFALLLPYAALEPAEFVVNTVAFLQDSLSPAIDSGNSGNIFLFTNQFKFESRLTEASYNKMLIDSLNTFYAIPRKGDEYRLVEGHIDYEDFALYASKPYFNHYTSFGYDPEKSFEKQLKAAHNPYLLPPDTPIEAMFLLEMPAGADHTVFYDILSYFAGMDVTPVYGVVENPALDEPLITTSVLYSRKPDELVEDFNRISHQHTQAKLRKSFEQSVKLPRLEVNLESEAKRVAEQSGADEDDILAVLRRLGKI